MKKLTLITAISLIAFQANAGEYSFNRIGFGKLDDMLAKYEAEKQPEYPQSFIIKFLSIPVKESPISTIKRINQYVNNSVAYKNEAVGDDVWQTPVETANLGMGDCEDYAIYKWHLLKQAGFHEDNMFFILGNATQGYHVTLQVNIGEQRYYLDNLSDDIMQSSINPKINNKINRTTHIIVTE